MAVASTDLTPDAPVARAARVARRRAGAVLAVVLSGGLLAWPLQADSVPPAVQRVLTDVFGFTRDDLTKLARGRTVVRALDVLDDREVSAVGVVHIDVPPAFYVAQMRDIVRFKRHEAVRQIGVFSQPAQPADLAALTLDRDHLQALRECTLEACDLNLSAAAIADARRSIPWGTPQAVARAQAWYRVTLARMVARYQATGERALMTYVSGTRALSLVDEFHALVTSPPALLRTFPTVYTHLTRYPHARAADVDDLLYWSKEVVGPSVVVSVTHMAIATLPTSSSPVSYVAASRQVYGSELYEASLGLTVLVRDPSSEGRMYLVYANRSRVDAIGGLLGPLKRAFVRSRARATLGPTLERAKRSVEQRFAEQDSGA